MTKRGLIIISDSESDFLKLIPDTGDRPRSRVWRYDAERSADCWYVKSAVDASTHLKSEWPRYNEMFAAVHTDDEAQLNCAPFKKFLLFSHISEDTLWSPHLECLVGQLLRLGRSDELDGEAFWAFERVCEAIAHPREMTGRAWVKQRAAYLSHKGGSRLMSLDQGLAEIFDGDDENGRATIACWWKQHPPYAEKHIVDAMDFLEKHAPKVAAVHRDFAVAYPGLIDLLVATDDAACRLDAAHKLDAGMKRLGAVLEKLRHG